MRVLLVGSVLVAGCSAASTSPSDALAVSATIAPAAVRAGDTATVRVAVTNRAGAPREINIATCPAPFVVTDESGAVAAPDHRTCDLALRTKALAPGEEFVFTTRWHAAVTPGVYALRGRVPARGGAAESEPVAVSVTP